MVAAAPPATGWRNRIVGHADVPPAELVANPRNWRTHPRSQRDALQGALDQVGWVQRYVQVAIERWQTYTGREAVRG